MSKMSRTKGHSFEREIARKFRRWFPNARRGLQYQDGEHCPDVQGTPFYIECKRYKAKLPYSLITLKDKAFKKMIEWRDVCGLEGATLIAYKLDREPIMVFMSQFVALDLGLDDPNPTWDDFAAALDDIYPIKQQGVG
jgi:Holliday junction resolvase